MFVADDIRTASAASEEFDTGSSPRRVIHCSEVERSGKMDARGLLGVVLNGVVAARLGRRLGVDELLIVSLFRRRHRREAA